MTASAETPAARVLPILFAYGKLALLVEDAPDAELRTARELYGADGLPQWWICVNNLEQAALAIQKAVAAVGDTGPDWSQGLPLLVVLDRYLQIGTGSGASRIIAWDRPGKNDPPAVEAMGEAVRLLQEHRKPPRRTSVLAAVTSYPEARAWPDFSWQPRHHEPLFRLRGELARDVPTLLSYGPAAHAPAISAPQALAGLEIPQREEMACRARLWHQALPSLASAFQEKDHPRCARILFTGAGASLANAPLSPGIPPTWFLLEWACWSVCQQRGLPGSEKRAEPIWPTLSKPHRDIPVHSLDHLIDLYRGNHSVAELDWEPLEHLFKPLTGRSSQYLDDFSRAFRHILLRYDHGFPHHLWLLAQLPWTLIVTTNFDGFHERAASAAVSSGTAFANDPIRRLGDLLPEIRKLQEGEGLVWDGPQTLDDLCAGPGLFKPYGSLTTMGSLALASKQFWDRVKPIGRCFDMIRETCDECWLVVVGHAMASSALDGTLVEFMDGGGAKEGLAVRVLWVDPMSCRLASRTRFDFPGRFQDGISEAESTPREAGSGAVRQYYPIPARALDFAYDLWQEYLRQKRQATGG